MSEPVRRTISRVAEVLAIRTEQGHVIRGKGAVRVSGRSFAGAVWLGFLLVHGAARDVAGEQVTLLGECGCALSRAVVLERRPKGERYASLRLGGLSELDYGEPLRELMAEEDRVERKRRGKRAPAPGRMELPTSGRRSPKSSHLSLLPAYRSADRSSRCGLCSPRSPSRRREAAK